MTDYKIPQIITEELILKIGIEAAPANKNGLAKEVAQLCQYFIEKWIDDNCVKVRGTYWRDPKSPDGFWEMNTEGDFSAIFDTHHSLLLPPQEIK